MNCEELITRGLEHIENDHVDKAVMVCLRIAKQRGDYLYIARFLRELHTNNKECLGAFLDETRNLKDEARAFVWKRSLEYWIRVHDIGYSLSPKKRDREKTLLNIAITEVDKEIEQRQQSISDFSVPVGMHSFDMAAFTDQYANLKSQIRSRIMALQKLKQAVKTLCFDFLTRVELQISLTNTSESFIAEMLRNVDNYFQLHSDEVFRKLQSVAQLVGSNDPEEQSLLLTQVRRAIKAAADYFYPARAAKIICSDGKERILDDDKYLNRLHEFMVTSFAKTASRDLLVAELEYLSTFARRLNEIASKGVHSDVSPEEAKQGVLGLYMLLYNVVSRMQYRTPLEFEAEID